MARTWAEDKEVIERHEHFIWEVVEHEQDGITPKKVEILKIKRNGSRTLWFKLHYLNGEQSTGLHFNGERFCSWCETFPLDGANHKGPPNTSGYCSLPKHTAHGVRCQAAFQRYSRVFNSNYFGYRTHTRVCRGCGKAAIQKSNETEYCQSTPKCFKMYLKVRRELAMTRIQS